MKPLKTHLLLLLLPAIISCSSDVANAPAYSGHVREITLIVASASDGNPIAGVQVEVVGGSGVARPLGATDSYGRLSLDAGELRKVRPRVLLFCHDHFFCGAIRIEGSGDFFEYIEHYIQLAPGAWL